MKKPTITHQLYIRGNLSSFVSIIIFIDTMVFQTYGVRSFSTTKDFFNGNLIFLSSSIMHQNVPPKIKKKKPTYASLKCSRHDLLVEFIIYPRLANQCYINAIENTHCY